MHFKWSVLVDTFMGGFYINDCHSFRRASVQSSRGVRANGTMSAYLSRHKAHLLPFITGLLMDVDTMSVTALQDSAPKIKTT